MKKIISVLAISMLLITFCSMTNNNCSTDFSTKLIGTWKWITVVNSETNETLGIEMMTMGLANEVKIQFNEDKTYIESKNKSKSDGYSTTKGQWKVEDNILSMKSKDKWRPSKIVKLSNDSLLVEIKYPMQILMIKDK